METIQTVIHCQHPGHTHRGICPYCYAVPADQPQPEHRTLGTAEIQIDDEGVISCTTCSRKLFHRSVPCGTCFTRIEDSAEGKDTPMADHTDSAAYVENVESVMAEKDESDAKARRAERRRQRRQKGTTDHTDVGRYLVNQSSEKLAVITRVLKNQFAIVVIDENFELTSTEHRINRSTLIEVGQGGRGRYRAPSYATWEWLEADVDPREHLTRRAEVQKERKMIAEAEKLRQQELANRMLALADTIIDEHQVVTPEGWPYLAFAIVDLKGRPVTIQARIRREKASHELDWDAFQTWRKENPDQEPPDGYGYIWQDEWELVTLAPFWGVDDNLSTRTDTRYAVDLRHALLGVVREHLMD
jgi:hypothetical protein